MSEAKTRAGAIGAAVEDFIARVEPPVRQEEARTLVTLFEKVTGEPARMWGASIIGFGENRTTYESGREVHAMRAGFSPRKAKHSLYLMGGTCDDLAAQAQGEALARLGKHKTGKSCLYVNKLSDIDLQVLEQMIAQDWAAMQRIYPN